MQPGEKFIRCLLDQSNEESLRARRLRRRTLLISIVIQALLLTLLLLRPLFGAQEIPVIARLVPLPPYRGGPAKPAPVPQRPTPPRAHHGDVVPGPILFPGSRRHPGEIREDVAPDLGPATGSQAGEGLGDPNGLLSIPGMRGDGRPLPLPPPPPAETPKHGPIRKPSEVQEALLIERIEPGYPPLARQIRLQGTVEIRAVIATDGAIESAEVLSGNPILARAALDAVLRWRYQPTLLNGRPVEVETIIRVIFKMP